jgi:hypothetical protein
MTKDWKEFAVSSRTRDPKPRGSGSWWLEAERDGNFVPVDGQPKVFEILTFTQMAQRLFVKQQESMSGIGPGQTWTKTAP